MSDTSAVHIGSADEFADRIRPHWPDMHCLARRMCGPGRSDDVVQDALTSAWRNRHQFDPVRGTARIWLLAIVANQARKSHRGDRPTVELIDDARTVNDVVEHRIAADQAATGSATGADSPIAGDQPGGPTR